MDWTKWPVLALAVGLGACDSLLDVERPGLITEEGLNQTPPVDALVAAAEGEYHIAFNWVAHSGASATDEAIFSHVWTPWNDYDERDVTAGGCPHGACGFGYEWMQRARVTGVRSAALLKAKQAPDSAIARAFTAAGYSTVLLADYLCEVPLNGGPPLASAVAYDSAIALFTEALQFAGTNAYVTNLANVGIARSHLNKNDLNKAVEFASKVPATFEAWVKYVDSDDFNEWSNKYNLFNRTAGREFNTALDPTEWATKWDRRVPFESDSTRPMFSPVPVARRGYFPYIPYSFEGWRSGSAAEHNLWNDSIPGGADIRHASGLEAQYIIAEASLYAPSAPGAWTEAQVRSFIDARRAVGAGAPSPYTGADLKGELRAQRRLDLFFAGYRLPDLIRYEKYGDKVDLWPRGTMGGYVLASGAPSYSSVKCWPVGQGEIATNPNYP